MRSGRGRREELGSIAALLLREDASQDSLHRAAADLYDLFASVAGAPSNDIDSTLPSGRALSPAAAATCVRDGIRTAVLLRAVRDVIREIRSRNGGGVCELVYAGAGPFAPLLLPLLTNWPADTVRCTLVDIHEDSARSLETLIDAFGFPGVSCVIESDATTYRHERPIDVVVAEVMQRALAVEPQVAIVRNLSTQLSEIGVLVPQEISIEVGLAPRRWVVGGGANGTEAFEPIGTVINLNANTFGGGSSGMVEETVVTMPEPREGAHVVYRTKVRAFRHHVLRDFDSGLSWPHGVWDLASWEPGERIAFAYAIDHNPGIRWRRM